MREKFEFHPFDEKDLIRYLKGMGEHEAHLKEMLTVFGKQLKDLDRLKVTDNFSIEERIREFSYGSHDNDGIVGGKHSNPDALFNVWYKIYRPYEIERKKIAKLYDEYAFEQMKTDCIRRCIYTLESKEKSLIEMVYIGQMKVGKYCNSRQIGHDTYGKIKRSALKNLRKAVNAELPEIYDYWKEKYEKNCVESRNCSSGSGSDSGGVHGTVSYRRLHRRAEKIPGVDK